MNIYRKLSELAQAPILWAATAGLVLALVLSVYLSGRVKLTVTRGVLQHFEKRVTAQGIPATPGKEWVDGRRLVRLSLWGKGNVGPLGTSGLSTTPGEILPAPDVGSLDLKGIVRYPDGTFEGVFLDRHTKKSIIVRKGEIIGGLKVLDIQPDQVIVSLRGKEAVFALFKEKAKKHPSSESRGDLPKASYEKGVASSHVVLAKREIQVALGDMASFLRQVRIIPYMEKGKAKGFQLLDIVPESIVSRVGLKNGDVIERVNGKAIRTPQDAMQFFSMLQSGRGVTLDVKRKDQHATISIDLK